MRRTRSALLQGGLLRVGAPHSQHREPALALYQGRPRAGTTPATSRSVGRIQLMRGRGAKSLTASVRASRGRPLVVPTTHVRHVPRVAWLRMLHH